MKQITLLCAAVLFIAACSKKDAGGSTTATTKTDLLTKKDWVRTSYQLKKQSDNTWTDVQATLSSYDKDDHLVFKADGTYELNEGATRYASTDPYIIETGTWKFAQNETLLILTKAGSSTTRDATIDALDGNTLSLSYSTLVVGIPYNYKEAYGH